MSTTVIPGLGPGLGQSINPFDPNYEKQVLIQTNQAVVDRTNADNAAKYKAHAIQVQEENIQQQANNLPLLTIDPPPHKKVLSADGLSILDSTELVMEPISVIPPPPPQNNQSQATGDLSALKAAPTLPDRTDRMIQMLMVLKSDIDAIRAKLNAN